MLFETDTGKTIVCSNATGPVFKVFDSASSAYDLDGNNTTTVRPLFHFDAAMWNGVDASEQPGDGATIDGDHHWTDRAHGKTTRPQITAADQPIFRSSGEGGEPYLDCDAGDLLWLTEPQGIHGNYSDPEFADLDGSFTLFGVAKGSATQQIAFVGMAISGVAVGNRPLYFSLNTNADYLFYGQPPGDVNGVHATIAHDSSNSYAVTRSWIIPRAVPVLDEATDEYESNTSIYVDGDNCVSDGTTWGPSVLLNPLVIVNLIAAAGYSMIGDFYEVALWDSDLSTADRNALGAYVAAKYGINFDTF